MAGDGTSAGSQQWLLFRAGTRLCALPLACVVETIRVLPVELLAEAAGFVGGVSIIRGSPVPVVEVGALFGEPETKRRRLITIDAGKRLVALAVDQVIGVSTIAADLLDGLPPLLREAAGDVVQAIGVLDSQLLLRLEPGRLVPEAALEAIGATEPAT
jgi:purine-binding chemotaxis protein CheW